MSCCEFSRSLTEDFSITHAKCWHTLHPLRGLLGRLGRFCSQASCPAQACTPAAHLTLTRPPLSVPPLACEISSLELVRVPTGLCSVLWSGIVSCSTSSASDIHNSSFERQQQGDCSLVSDVLWLQGRSLGWKTSWVWSVLICFPCPSHECLPPLVAVFVSLAYDHWSHCTSQRAQITAGNVSRSLKGMRPSVLTRESNM
jgi:hypothetical protein